MGMTARVMFSVPVKLVAIDTVACSRMGAETEITELRQKSILIQMYYGIFNVCL